MVEEVGETDSIAQSAGLTKAAEEPKRLHGTYATSSSFRLNSSRQAVNLAGTIVGNFRL